MGRDQVGLLRAPSEMFVLTLKEAESSGVYCGISGHDSIYLACSGLSEFINALC